MHCEDVVLRNITEIVRYYSHDICDICDICKVSSEVLARGRQVHESPKYGSSQRVSSFTLQASDTNARQAIHQLYRQTLRNHLQQVEFVSSQIRP